jgi:hypothetical protein
MLRAAGHDVYDFRNPREDDSGFRWSDIDPDWKSWTPKKYRQRLDHPIVEAGYKSDFDAMTWAECFVGVQPFGRSASLEMGWSAGNGKKTVLLLENGEPELMVKMLDHICCDIGEVLEIVGNPKASGLRIGCDDCGRKYGEEDWIEAIIPDKVWNKIRPDGYGKGGGILCISCIAKRLKEKGYKRVPVWLLGTEPLRAMPGDPIDTPEGLWLLRLFPGIKV